MHAHTTLLTLPKKGHAASLTEKAQRSQMKLTAVSQFLMMIIYEPYSDDVTLSLILCESPKSVLFQSNIPTVFPQTVTADKIFSKHVSLHVLTSINCHKLLLTHVYTSCIPVIQSILSNRYACFCDSVKYQNKIEFGNVKTGTCEITLLISVKNCICPLSYVMVILLNKNKK